MSADGLLVVREATRAAVTDLGRTQVAHLGIQTGGAADQVSARIANLLVGNPQGAPLLETSLTPLAVALDTPALVAVTGAVAEATLDGVPMAVATTVLVWPGAVVRVVPGGDGVHAYLAVHGTIAAPALQGSVAPDAMLGHGSPLAPGGTVHVRGCDVAQPLHLPLFRLTADAALRRSGRADTQHVLDVLAGPELDEFPGLVDAIAGADLVVSPTSDRAGTRLDGLTLERSASTEILSRGVPLGAIEVPPAGSLIALQRQRPLTAGYPIPLVVARASHHDLAQLAPGAHVRLRLVDLPGALASHARLESAIVELGRRAALMLDAAQVLPACRPASIPESLLPAPSTRSTTKAFA